MNQPCRMSLLGQMGMTKREETPLPPCSIRDRDLGLAALARRFFTHWGLKGQSQGCTSAADGGAGCQKGSAGMKEGCELRTCCQSHRNLWACLRSHRPAHLHGGFGYTSVTEQAPWPHPAPPRTRVLSCHPAWMLVRTELSPQSPAPANIAKLHLRSNTVFS